MAETAYLASAAVTGIAVLAVWAFVTRMEDWRHYDAANAEGAHTSRSPDATDSVGTWAAAFFALVLVAGGGAVLLVSDVGVASAVGDWVAVGSVLGVSLLGFLLWGTYSSARFRGLRSAQAALLSAWLFGSLFVAAVAVKLVLGG
ncbi:hypothetical protein [Halorussus sp. MSC15.2]|uniref:hypothetical protein n=1 Tax=Halorussus sp. MSC15.2 TaxID=2283638 RepID=UPI0013D370F0|nr:hypothetical protein [Halorussus sp. MSC15.2]NEU58049.1 hypothetical protein [Halorussus sp. MSC15.2]